MKNTSLTSPHRSLFAFALVSSFFACTKYAPAADQPRPNILFIMADDHAAHAISAYGSKINETPNIDRLAHEGMRFSRCLVTNSICTPSRAAILTGKYSHINGVPVFNAIDGRQPMLQKYLKKAGYYTGVVGKWHLGPRPTGFDYSNVVPGQGAYHNPKFTENDQPHQVYTGYVTDIITDMSINFLKRRPQDQPFLLLCHHKAPHRNWQPDDKHAAKFKGAVIPEPDTLNDDYATRSDAARQAAMTIETHLSRSDLKPTPPPGLNEEGLTKWRKTKVTEVEVEIDGEKRVLTGDALKKWKYQRYMQDYLACVASVDDNVGRLLKYLDESGLAENTIVIYTSDQGFFLGDHGWYDKRFMYEESLIMPCLIRWPGVIHPGSINDKMILNVDFAPTLLAAAGHEVPDDMQGRSFLPLLRGEVPNDWRTSMYYRYYDHFGSHNVQQHYGVRTERYKLLHFHRLNAWEMYDLQTDRHELKNLADDPAHVETRKQLEAELYRLKKELRDKDQFVDNLPKFGV